jgi:light-regulated signal transduction histidine kinase (bacteriophytochrome)
MRKDGSKFWANVVITAVYNNNRQHIGFSKVTRDLTERKASEIALKESESKYRKLAEELKVTNQELEQFNAIVSHDLQEPLRSIKSFMLLIEQHLHESASSQLKHYVIKAISRAEKMKELILNLLHYAQIGKDELFVDNVNFDELITDVLQSLKDSIDNTFAKVTIHNEIESIRGDRIQLSQLFQNLISNALKFISDKRPEIYIVAKNGDDAYQFSISDNGIGIAPEHQKKLFQIFKRVISKNKYPGTGIGLSICKKIVERHHGHIWLESQLGKGTTFHFTLGFDQSIGNNKTEHEKNKSYSY